MKCEKLGKLVSNSLRLFMFLTVQHVASTQNNVSHFVIEEVSFERLCESKKVLTVNQQFPGPTIYAWAGETLVIDLENKGSDNVTIYWRGGISDTNYRWLIQPGLTVRQTILLSRENEGTLWWHAISVWQSATIHGSIVVYSKTLPYSFPNFHADIPIIFGEWWKKDLKKSVLEYVESGSKIMNSDAFMINGQPGEFYPCSNNETTFKIVVEARKTYLLRLVNGAMGKTLFVGIAKHKLTIVAMDGRVMTTPISTMDYIKLSVQQSIDCILEADQQPDYYYIAAREYVSTSLSVQYDNTTTTAILKYKGNYIPSSHPFLPLLPNSYYYDKNPNTNSKINSSNSILYLVLIFVLFGLVSCCPYYVVCFGWRIRSGTVNPLA